MILLSHYNPSVQRASNPDLGGVRSRALATELVQTGDDFISDIYNS